MRNAVIFTIVLLMQWYTSASSSAADWLTLPGRFSHDPVTQTRIAQFQPVASPSVPEASNFRTSGYTHVRSSLNFGLSADNYHRVETWGDPVRPYGEWQFPFRPYSVPYAAWGAPFAGLNIGPNFYGAPGAIPLNPIVPPLLTPYGSGMGGSRMGHPNPWTQNRNP